jgi:hypothetical protein
MLNESQSVELHYRIEGNAPESVEREVQERVARYLQDLATDETLRNAVRAKDPTLLAKFDEMREALERARDPKATITSVIDVQSEGAGIEPGTVLILVTLAPPIFEHLIAPVAVHVCKSLWDNFLLPEIKKYFKRVEPK